ncbi:fumarylacetoacetate hydrolase family protein [Ottowia caeni]|uniref:fumarylacetoacetate hydrolase family protein n=1 Tax=Ottowia caeni TaxID=2870339 RepID=UPI003D715897|nr:fumarylacetoacetate hydrolase family protein [Ottowia caeni]
MRWIRYSTATGPAYGILEDKRIWEVNGNPFTNYERTKKSIPLESVEVLIPVEPRTFYCVGLNYVNHIKDPSRIPPKPDIGYRANNALTAHKQPVIIPADANKIHYEGELVVVIGKKARNLSMENALSCVLGYTIGNDVSERNWQKEDRTFWRAKNSDTFKPMGPWIETEVDFSTMETSVRVNGTVTTQFRTADMLFSVEHFIAAMTRYITLYPGDIIWMGTDGVSPDLKPGDIVDVEISGIGTLTSTFVAADKNTLSNEQQRAAGAL